MAEKKITKRESFTEIKGILEELGKERLAKVMEHELELLAKKNASGEGKMTATQKANEEIKDVILENLANKPDRLYTVTEMLKEFECCKPYTNQKISALIKQLVTEGKVAKIEDKRKSYFKIA